MGWGGLHTGSVLDRSAAGQVIAGKAAALQVEQPRDVDAGPAHGPQERLDAGGDDVGGLRAGVGGHVSTARQGPQRRSLAGRRVARGAGGC